MKQKALALFAFVVLMSIVIDLKMNAQQSGNGVIEIAGVTLRLGMTKATISEKLASVPITKDREDFWIIGSKSSSQYLQFTNGRLTYVSRNWVTYDNDIVAALHGAVSSLNREGYRSCNVEADSKVDPDSTLQRIWIRCGEKSILVSRASLNGKSYNTVDEELGTIR
ncbi:MAG: hypothetical protein LAP21_09305 [Acidobacteriia bacterium]|nr:hypothetical protein [Terriglobia bacterium]